MLVDLPPVFEALGNAARLDEGKATLGCEIRGRS